MKSNLIDTLFKVFEKDKLVIKKNLMQVMDEIVLQTQDEYGKVCLIIKYERNDANGETK
ncbi:MAG: hypothetical protein IKV94_02760 [Clostridia bacterium]|nr:hypothetical protein [Clostridia bacterium]MBR6517137.1 hypothetical protein [Bacilli bacterium]